MLKFIEKTSILISRVGGLVKCRNCSKRTVFLADSTHSLNVRAPFCARCSINKNEQESSWKIHSFTFCLLKFAHFEQRAFIRIFNQAETKFNIPSGLKNF